MKDVAYAFTLCLATLGPTKTIPVFYLATRGSDWRTILALAAKSTLVATAIVLFVALGASGTLATWQVSIEAVEIAGGIVLALAAVKTLTSPSFAELQTVSSAASDAKQSMAWLGRPVLAPLAVPGIVPPVGVMVVLFFAATTLGDVRQQADLAIVLVAIMVMNFAAMLFARPIMHFVGIPVLQITGWVFFSTAGRSRRASNHRRAARATHLTGEVTMTIIHGKCDSKFSRVRDVLAANLASGADIGASVAVYIGGEPVVDIWGGWLDREQTKPWARDTIVNTFSTTKTMTALCVLILADRGMLDLDAPIAQYWPEFASAGKERVLVRHVLGHTAGLPGWTADVTLADICDHEKAASLLAQQAPWWEPGTRIGYHAITYGPLLGEVIRRVTGKTLGRFLAEEVAAPLRADYHIGTGPEQDDRIAPLIQSSPPIVPANDGSMRDRVFFNPLVLPPDAFTPLWRRAELGGSNGYGNARSVAAVQSALACGGEVRGVRLLSASGCERALELQGEGADIIAGFPLRWGMGYGINSATIDAIYGHRLTGRRIAFWGGSGGSIVINDLDARMTVAYVMNKHVEHGGIDQRGIDIAVAAYDSLTGRDAGPKPVWTGVAPAAA